MSRSLRRRNLSVLGLVTALVSLSIPFAHADNVIADGDGIAPVAAHDMSFGPVCVGAPVSKPVALAAVKVGGGNVFASGATVTFSASPAGAGLSVAMTDASLLLPADWAEMSGPPTPSSDTATATVTFTPGALGAFSGSVTFSGVGAKDGGGTLTRTDVMSVSATVAACDTTPPTLHLPVGQSAEATSASGAVVNYTATADDTSPAHPTVSCSPASGSTFALGTTTVNCSATDAAGNTATGSFPVSVADTTAPVVGAVTDVTLEAEGPSGAVVTFTTPSATDAVTPNPTVTCTPASGSTFALGSTLVSCEATDAAGNTGKSPFTVKIVDTTKPALVLPGPITAEATSPDGATVTYSPAPSATDIVDGPVAVGCTPLSGSLFGLGVSNVMCTASDNAGNKADGSFSVTVRDTTAPAISVANISGVEATSANGAVVNYSPTATDAVDVTVPVSCTPASGSTFALGSTTVNCSATDKAGNTGTASFTVQVVDTTAPTLSLPGDKLVEATGPGGAAVTFTATATDTVDSSVTVICDPASGSTFALGATTVACSAADDAGNPAMGSFTVTVVDTTDPVLAAHADVTAEATGPAGAAVTYTAPSATDLVDQDVTVTCSPVSGSTFVLGPTTVTCTATDDAGNDATSTFKVKVVDTTAPAIDAMSNLSVEATGPSGAVVTFTAPSATDLVDGPLSTTCDPASGSTFGLGQTTVTCSVSDAAGNPATRDFKVTITDTTGPVLSLPGNITKEATGPGGAVATWTASATDLVDGSRSVSCAPPSGSTFALGTATVNCSASDTRSNTTSGSFTVTVRDTTPPAITVPANITAAPTSISGAAVSYSASATDLVDGPVAVSCTPPSGSVFGFGTTTVTCSVSDAAGNTATKTFTVTVSNFTFLGFYQPVDMGSTVNTVKAGSTVPFKWNLRGANGVEITSTASVLNGWPKQVSISCSSLSSSEDAIETTTTSTGGSSLRYDSTGGQFVYNWQTPKQAGTCWRVDVKFVDGSVRSANFKLK